MAKPKNFLSLRTMIQSISLLVLHANFAQWLGAMRFCNPVMSCHACPLAWCACPIGVFSHLAFFGPFPWLAAGTIIALGALFGRLLCGWVCPFGFLQDLLHRIPSKKGQLPGWADLIKYPLLLLTVFLLPGIYGVEISFCTLCPTSYLQVSIPYYFTSEEAVIDLMFLLKGGVTVAVLLLSVFYSRFFCRVICPIGALLAIFNYLCFWRVKTPTHNCVSCGRCNTECPTATQPATRFLHGIDANHNTECITCHDCRPVCPVKDKG